MESNLQYDEDEINYEGIFESVSIKFGGIGATSAPKDEMNQLINEPETVSYLKFREIFDIPESVPHGVAYLTLSTILDCVIIGHSRTIYLEDLKQFHIDMHLLKDMHFYVTHIINKNKKKKILPMWLTPRVKELIEHMDVEPDGVPDTVTLVENLGLYGVLREAVRAHQEMELFGVEKYVNKYESSSVASDESIEEEYHVEHLTEEEILDRELERTTEVYWNKKAEAIFLRADQAQQDKCLSKQEIKAYLATKPPPEEAWILEWLMVANGGQNFHAYDTTKDGEISLRELKEACKDWAIKELGSSFANTTDASAAIFRRELNERAETIMKKADKMKRNYKLTRDEIQAFGNLLADADEKKFIFWILKDNNFDNLDEDSSGEIDLHEFQHAIKAWADESRKTRLNYVEKNRALMDRKRALREERKDMLKNADSRASEIMELCNFGSSGHTITIHTMRTKILPVEKLRPFAEWMLKDRMRVWRRHDKDKSGTIDLGELENALEEYFDEVASEFDEFKGEGNYYMKYRGNRRTKRILAELGKRPTPPMFKGSDGDKVTFEWRKEWKGFRLVLQSLIVNSHSVEDASQPDSSALVDGKLKWVTIYRGKSPRADIVLSQPTALYLFRTITVDKDGKELQMELSSSNPVFWMSRPSPPTLCGIGRNVLVSWSAPVLPPVLASTLKPSRPFWKLHVKKLVKSPPRQSQDHSKERKTTIKTNKGESTSSTTNGSSTFVSSDKGNEELVINVGQGHTWSMVPNLSVDSEYAFSLSIEFPMGPSNKSSSVRYSTKIQAPCIRTPSNSIEQSQSSDMMAGIQGSGKGKGGVSLGSGPLKSGSSDALTVQLPLVNDSVGALETAQVTATYRTEGLGVNGTWDMFHKGSEQELDIHGFTPDIVSKLRVRVSLDLRRCCRYGDGPIHVYDAPFRLEHNPLVELGLAPPSAFGSNLYNDDVEGGGGIDVHKEVGFDESEVGSLVNSNESVDSHDTKRSSVTGAAWACPIKLIPFPGASKARSEKFAELVALHTLEFENPDSYFWDMSNSAIVCIAPSLPSFDADEVKFSKGIEKEASESLLLTCSQPKYLTLHNNTAASDEALPLTQRFAVEVFDKRSERWFQVYNGSSPDCDLAEITRNELSMLRLNKNDEVGTDYNSGGEEEFNKVDRTCIPSDCWTLPGVCLLVRTALQVSQTSPSSKLAHTSKRNSAPTSSKNSRSVSRCVSNQSDSGRHDKSSSSKRLTNQTRPSSKTSMVSSIGSDFGSLSITNGLEDDIDFLNNNNNNGSKDSKNETPWMYSEEMVVMMSPQPPWCEWCDPSNRRAVIVKWTDTFDLSKLPAGITLPPLLFSLEVATGPLLNDEGNGVEERVDPLVNFEEVAVSPGSHFVNSGPLVPGSRYAFRLRCNTPNGSCVSAPYYVKTEPTVPSIPDLPVARSALFKSATRKQTSFVQISWKCPEHNGLKVDRYLLQSRATPSEAEQRQEEEEEEEERGQEAEDGSPCLESQEEGGGGEGDGKAVPLKLNKGVNPKSQGRKAKSRDSEWSSIYIGAHLSASDESTLHLVEVNKQYRVRAGSQLGWGGWSPIVTVQGQLDSERSGSAILTPKSIATPPIQRGKGDEERSDNDNTSELVLPALVLPRSDDVDGQLVGEVEKEQEVEEDSETNRNRICSIEVANGERFESQMVVPCEGFGERMQLTLYVGTASERVLMKLNKKRNDATKEEEQNGSVVGVLVACSSVVGVSDKELTLELSEVDFSMLGAEKVLLPLTSENTTAVKRAAAQKLFDMIQINASGNIFCVYPSPPSKALSVTLLSRSPPTFLLTFPDHSGSRVFVRGSNATSQSESCELKVLFPRLRTALTVSVDKNLLHSLGIKPMVSSENGTTPVSGWSFATEGLRLAVLSKLCEMLIVDQTNGAAHLEATQNIPPQPDENQLGAGRVGGENNERRSAAVYWNPIKGSQFSLMDSWEGSSSSFLSRNSMGNRSQVNSYENDSNMSIGQEKKERQDIEDRVVSKVVSSLKFGVNESVLRKVVTSSLDSLLNSRATQDDRSQNQGNRGEGSASSVLLPDIRGLGMASLTALVQAAALSELNITSNTAASPSESLARTLNSTSSTSSQTKHVTSPDSRTVNSTTSTITDIQKLRAQFNPVLPTDNLTSYSLPCPVLSKKRGGKGSPSKLPPLPMVPFKWGYTR